MATPYSSVLNLSFSRPTTFTMFLIESVAITVDLFRASVGEAEITLQQDLRRCLARLVILPITIKAQDANPTLAITSVLK